jgi:hypothetical protein
VGWSEEMRARSMPLTNLFSHFFSRGASRRGFGRDRDAVQSVLDDASLGVVRLERVDWRGYWSVVGKWRWRMRMVDGWRMRRVEDEQDRE